MAIDRIFSCTQQKKTINSFWIICTLEILIGLERRRSWEEKVWICQQIKLRLGLGFNLKVSGKNIYYRRKRGNLSLTPCCYGSRPAAKSPKLIFWQKSTLDHLISFLDWLLLNPGKSDKKTFKNPWWGNLGSGPVQMTWILNCLWLCVDRRSNWYWHWHCRQKLAICKSFLEAKSL